MNTDHITTMIWGALASTIYGVKSVTPIDGGWRWELMDIEYGAIVGEDRRIDVTEAEVEANTGRERLTDLIAYKVEQATSRRPETPPEPVITQILRWMGLTRGLVWQGSTCHPDSATHMWIFDDTRTGRKVTVLVTDLDIDDGVSKVAEKLHVALAKRDEQGDDPPADAPPMG
jgi:hypothetical protein